MSTNLFSGARKALVASIAAAVLLGGAAVVTTPYAAAATVAAVSVSAKINAFTNTDWLNGVWRTGAGFSTSALSIGTHILTASVTDSRGLVGSTQISVTVSANAIPSVSITSPVDGSTTDAGSAHR